MKWKTDFAFHLRGRLVWGLTKRRVIFFNLNPETIMTDYFKIICSNYLKSKYDWTYQLAATKSILLK